MATLDGWTRRLLAFLNPPDQPNHTLQLGRWCLLIGGTLAIVGLLLIGIDHMSSLTS
jgi:hypothetical protein